MNTVAIHPALQPSAARLSIIAVIILRSCFLCILVLLLDNAIDFGTSLGVLSGAVIAGTIAASLLSFTRLRTFGFFLLLALFYVCIKVGSAIFSLLPLGQPGKFFLPLSLQEHLWLATVFFLFAALITWAFWKWRHALTFEILVILGMSLHLLSGHRNYHFESPRIMNSLAWTLGVQQLWIFILAGAAIAVLVMLYIYCTSQPVRAVPYFEFVGFRSHHGKLNWKWGILFVLVLVGLLYAICTLLFGYYNQEVLSRTANGVGEREGEGVSPLDFHSALGSTSQSAALVRLEGDYKENPFTPMLYMREAALSTFDGHQMVQAPERFDQDITRTDPSQVWTGREDARLSPRVPLNQSIFLLTEHKLAFAVDYPLSLTQIKNPNPRRFKSTYRAYSMAPAFKAENLQNAKVGDPHWTADVWQHYLKQHQDPRYKELAFEITGEPPPALPEKLDYYYLLYGAELNDENFILDRFLYQAFIWPIEGQTRAAKTAANAFSITEYLKRHAIYTLTPNHDVGPDDDPVAPFLFGDKRGYCVHFAHATVYMLRSLGIPSRIATGYLTDLSQSRDGHVLLRMSDRHAWAEVYIEGFGWVPFDTQPEQVESHADTQVDMKLLEELMGMLGPSEDILPPEIAKDEPNVEEPSLELLPDRNYVLLGILLFFLFFVSIKSYLRFGWLVAGNVPAKLRSSYRSVASYLYDLGYQRRHGETREEFRQRISKDFGFDTLALTGPLNLLNYSAEGNKSITPKDVGELREADLKILKLIPLWKRILVMLSPASLIAFLSRTKW